MTTLFLRERRVLALAILMILALGATAILTIGRQEDPTITNIFAGITTPFPGASPERVEALVTEKIEAELRKIPQIKEISSTSSAGISAMRVELSSFITDAEIDRTWSEIRDALADAAAKFPPGVPDPEFENDRAGAYTAIFSLTARPQADPSPGLLARHAEMLRDRLRALPGVRRVDVYGAAEEEIRVALDGVRAAGLGLTPQAIATALAQADAKVNAGRAAGETSDFLLEVAGEFDAVARVRDVPLRVAGRQGANAPAGRAALRVGDVAVVTRAERAPRESLAWSEGRPAVLIAARMEDDLQVDKWMARVRAAAQAVDMPAGLKLEQFFDQSAYTAARLKALGVNIAMGVGLVVAVLFVTLGWRAAVVVALALPLTTMLSIAILKETGIVIHQMSVTGLIVALGLLVDAAIVMTDEIRKRLIGGMAVLDAVDESVRRLAVPLLASTVTTALAFLPMAALPGPAGDFVGAIAISVIVMLFSSLAVALTITPALAGLLLPGGLGGRGMLAAGLSGGAFGRLFAWSIDMSLRHRVVALAAALALPAMGFAAFPTLTAQFFPGVDRDQFHVQAKLPDGASIRAAEATARRIDALLAAANGVRRVDWVIGESAPPFYYNMEADRRRTASFAEALVSTDGPAITETLIPQLQAAFDRAIPEAQVLVRGLVQGPPVSAPIEMRLVGPDLEVLRRLGDEARALMARQPAVIHTRADLMGGAPKYVFEIDEDKARLAGLGLHDIAGQLAALTTGVSGGSVLEGTQELPVRVILPQGERASPAALAALNILGPKGELIPATALGAVRLSPSESPISRRNGERVNNVQAFLTRGVLPEEALKGLQAALAETPLRLPPGVRIEWGGDSDAREDTVANLISTLGVVIVGTVATIVLTFNSFRLSLAGFAVMGLSMGLSLLSLAVFQYPFGITALIGVIGSIGVSINAAIILITGMQEDPAAARGDRAAMRKVVVGASRHIVSTTVTTFGGFLPLILAGGGFWPPFAMAIAGGVLLSTVVSFYFVPPVFSLLVPRRAQAADSQAARA